MTSSVQHFHFTLGPVQGFVAQARRTRDFWAGSFLLSWLAGVAMKAVMVQGGAIVFPKPDTEYLAWLEGHGRGGRPRQGGIPNRFKAEVGASFKPADVVQSVRLAWQKLAETVWEEDLSWHRLTSPATRDIWDRQIDAFWEISWALGDDDALLDRRKNWRSHLPPTEPGIKCAMMAGWQELSGLSSPDPKTRDDFWQPLRDRFGRDLAEGEALCAIAFVKRRFARHFEQVQAHMLGGWTLRGWPLDTRVPSVLDLAAANWLARLVQQEPDEAALLRLHQAAGQLFAPDEGSIGELRCVWEAYPSRGGAVRDLRVLNSNALFAHMLDNPKECSDQAAVRVMKQAIKDLDQQAPPSPFYAVLLMDGDSLGSLLRQPDAQPKVSKALEDFTREAPNLVDRHNGFLIYAGGDDVLALLPLEDAMRCAADLRRHYLESFRAAFGRGDNPSTLSGAIEYAHVKMPLTQVLRDAHVLLDEVAKDGRGRDALAVRVWKPGGKALEWAMPWEKALDKDSGRLEIEQIAEQFAGDEAEFSSKFFYKIRERFDLLNPARSGSAEKPAIFGESQARALLAVDYLASGINAGRETKLKLADAERIIRPLLTQCRPVFRHPGAAEPFSFSQRLEVDGALLVRFLAQKGAERR